MYLAESSGILCKLGGSVSLGLRFWTGTLYYCSYMCKLSDQWGRDGLTPTCDSIDNEEVLVTPPMIVRQARL